MSTRSTVFRCLSCGQFIGIDAKHCRFCSSPVDRQAAETACEIQGKVNAAYNEANHLKWMVLAVLGFYVSIYVTLLVDSSESLRKFLLSKKGALVELTLPVLCTLAIIVLILRIVRWQSKYSGFQTDNPDMMQAQAAARVAFIAWCVLCGAMVLFLIPVLVWLR